MIEKTIPINYDYSDHTIQWQVEVNRNKMPMTGAVVTDILPSGMQLLIDGTHSIEILRNGALDSNTASYTTAVNGDTTFTFNLSAVETTDQFTIR